MNTDSTIFGGKLMKWLLFCITLLAFTQIKAQPCSNPPVMNLTGGGAVCENSTTTVNFNITGGTPPWRIVYAINGVNQPTLIAVASPFTISTGTAGTYTGISVIDAQNCTGTITGTGVTVTVTPMPVVDAGVDFHSCAGLDPVQVNGFATNYSSITWTNTGNGYFEDPHALNTLYYPDESNLSSGKATLTLTVTALAPCSGSVSDQITVTIDEGAVANAGGDATHCGTTSYNITGASASAYSSVSWSTSGTGSFTSQNTLNATYTPSAADVAAGSVTLSLSAFGIGPCINIPAVDSKVLFLSPEPTVNAGQAEVVCEGSALNINDATASSYSSVIWTTSGTGTFVNNGTLTPTYIPSTQDIQSGNITLTLSAVPIAPCLSNVTSSKAVSFVRIPTVYAGSDGSVCDLNPYPIGNAQATYYYSLVWSTSGTGSFSNPTSLNTIYLPSVADLSTGSVTLTLTAYSDPTCSLSESDQQILTLVASPSVNAGTDASACEGTTFTVSGATAQNYATIFWTTNGTGILTNAGSLNPSYTPSHSDALAGTVTLTLSATGNSPCSGTVTDAMQLTVTPLPVIDAGNNITACNTLPVDITSASAQNYSSIVWTTSGTGTFSNPYIVNPSYTPSAQDVVLGSVVLTMNVSPLAPCSVPVSDNILLTLTPVPLVNAGFDNTSCNGMYQISGASANNYSSLAWSSTGTGILLNQTTLSPTYLASAQDIINGSVQLILTAQSIAPCTQQVSDYMVLTLNPMPQADAGLDVSICETSSFQVNTASATDYGSLYWTTSGSGTFSGQSTLYPIYTPSISDINSGSVTLTLTATSELPCTTTDSDQMLLTFVQPPVANAGINRTVCENNSVTLSGTVSNNSGFAWSTLGDGTFANSTTLTPTYTPGTGDILAGSVTIILTANPTGACTSADSDDMIITIVDSPEVNAGPDQSVCGNVYTLTSATASDYISLQWTSTGSGTFLNGNLPNATYQASPSDLAAGSVTLIMTAIGLPPCSGQITDQMVLTFTSVPVAYAGQDATTCGGNSYVINDAYATNYSMITWSTSGSGNFSGTNEINPTYTASAADIASGSVTLTMTVTGYSICNLIETDAMVLSFTTEPIANAGNDISSCGTSPVAISTATASGYSTINWTHNGSGVIQMPNSLSPVYLPSQNDLLAGSVILTLNAIGNSPCTGNDTDQMLITLFADPTVNAGTDFTVCENTNAVLGNASATGFSTTLWTTNGTGVFSNNANINPIYYPSQADIAAGSVTLTLTATGIPPCNTTVTDNMVLTIDRSPVADAGPDATVCGNSHYLGGASAQYYSSVLWTTSGTGTFSNPAILNSVYSPSAADVLSGTVILTLTVSGQGTCNVQDADNMILTMGQAAMANAGVDASVCGTNPFTVTTASASVISVINWTTSGSGSFANQNSINPTYTPSAGDAINGTVTLTLNVQSGAPCSGNAQDQMILTISAEAIANAGPDASICNGDVYTISGANAANYVSLSWITSGSGTFSNGNTLTPTYIPSIADYQNGSVRLGLNAIPNAPCTGSTYDEMLLTFVEGPVAEAGPDADICTGSGYTVTGASAINASTIQWTSTGSGTLLNSNTLNPTYIPSNYDLAAGSVILFMNVTGTGACSSASTDFMTLHITGLPVGFANITGPQNVCSGQANVIYEINPPVQNATSYNWSVPGGATIVSGDGTASIVVNFSASAVSGDIIVTPSSSCGSGSPSSYAITIGAGANAPGAITGSSDFCAGATNVSYTVPFDPTVSGYQWTVPTGAVITSGNGTNTITVDFSFTAVSGNISVTASNSCGASAPSVLWINVLPTPTKPVITSNGPLNFCFGNDVTLTAPSGYTSYLWSSGETTQSIIVSTNGSYYVQVTDNNGCASVQSDPVTVTVGDPLPSPVITANGPTAICAGQSVTLMAPAGYATYVWSTGQTSQNITVSAPGDYYVTVTDYNGCQSLPSNTITVSYLSAATVYAGADGTVCSGNSFSVTDATATNYSTVSWTSSGSGTFINPGALNTTYIPSVQDGLNGSVMLTLTAEGCDATTTSDFLVLTVVPAPSGNTGGTLDICFMPSPVTGTTATGYSSLQWSVSFGTGSLINSTSLIPTYVPAAGDLTNGYVLLSLTLQPLAPCSNQLVLTKTLNVHEAPVVNAGPDTTICAGTSLTVNGASAQNYTSVQWSSTGNGTWLNANTLMPTYMPSNSDIAAGSVILTLTASGNGCPEVTDILILSIQPEATVSAGNDGATCEGSNFQINGASAVLASSIQWTTSGSGTFSNPAIINPIYSPSPADIAAGSVQLTVTATSSTPCNGTVSDALTLIIRQEPTADAGTDGTICKGEQYVVTDAVAANFSSVIWATSGSGMFISGNTLTPTYIPSQLDVLAGSVVLTLIASNAPCADVVDSQTLTIIPAATVEAGPDVTICQTCSHTVSGAFVNNAISFTWTSTGTGTLTNANSLTPTYQPSAQDIANGSVTLILTAESNGGCGSFSDQMVININQNPELDFTWEGQCEGEPTNFIVDENITNINEIAIWNWNFGDGFYSNVMNPVHTFPATGEYNVTLTVRDTAGNQASVSHTISIMSSPVSFFSFETPNCLGSPTQFMNYSSTENGYITTWVWNFGDGTPDVTVLFPNDPNVEHQYATEGIYEVTLTVTNNFGCDNTYSTEVTITPTPVANFYYSSSCEDMVVDFQDASFPNGAGNIVSWNWNFGDPASGVFNTSNLADPQHIFTTPGLYTVTLYVVNFNNCADTITKQVNAGVAPPVAFTWEASCAGTTTGFFTDPSVVNVNTISTYLWEFGDGGQSNLQNPEHMFTTSGDYTVTLTITDTAGCVNSISNLVTISGEPVAFFSFSNPVCNQDEMQFTNQSYTSGGYIVSWNWNFGDGNSTTVNFPDDPNVSHIYAASGSYNVTLTITTSTGCENVNTQMVTIQPSPVANFTNNNACLGVPIEFTDQSQANGSGQIINYAWDFGDPASGTGNASGVQNPSHIFSAAGTYTVSLQITSSNSCVDTVTKVVVINPAPVVDFTSTSGCAGDTVTFISSTFVNVPQTLSWLWNFGDGTTSNIADPLHIYNTQGTYTVTLSITDITGCSSSVSHNVSVVSGPVAMFTNSAPVCSGSAVEFTDMSIAMGNPITTWHWEFGDGNEITVDAPSNPNVNHTYDTPGNYTVTLTVTNMSGCNASISSTLSTIAGPTSAFSFEAGCQGSPVQFSDITNTNGGAPIIQWSWNFGDPVSGAANISYLQNPAHIYSAAGTYTVVMYSTSASGCQDSTSQIITITAPPAVAFMYSSSCAGQPVTFEPDPSVMNPADVVLYNWDFGDGSPSSNQMSPTHTYAIYGTYTVTLTVTNADGCIASTSRSVVITAEPVAAFNSSSTCSGNAVQFTDYSYSPTGDQIIAWHWVFGDPNGGGSDTSNLQHPEYTYSQNGNYNVTLTATSISGCSNTVTIPVQIVPAPVASYSYITNACQNGTVSFQDESTAYMGTVNAWQWEFEPYYYSNLENPVHTFMHTDSCYNVQLIITDIRGCSDTTIQEVCIPAGLQLAVDYNSTCIGDTTQFSAMLVAPANDSLVRFEWNFDDMSSGIFNTSTLENPVHYFENPGNYMVSLKATDINNCTSTIYQNVTINSLPQPEFSFNPGNCDSTLYFTDMSAANGNDIVTWIWSYGDGAVDTLHASPANTSHYYATTGNFAITLTTITSSGCSNTITRQIDKLPCILAGFTQLDTLICQRNTIEFQDNSVCGNPINNWTWYFGDGNSLNYTTYQSSVEHYYETSGMFNVSLVVTTSLSGASVSDTITQTVVVLPSPEADYKFNDVCLNAVTIFTDDSQWSQSRIKSWNWDFGDPMSVVDTSSSRNPAYKYTLAGLYRPVLTVTNDYGCSDTATNAVYVHNYPHADFDYTVACMNSRTTFMDESDSADSAIDQWWWKFRDTLNVLGLSGTANPDFIFVETGDYEVELMVTNLNGCSDTVSKIITVNPKPTSAFSYVENYENEQGKVKFTNESEGAKSYEWNFGIGTASFEVDPVVTFPSNGKYEISLVALNEFDCPDTLKIEYTLLYKGLWVPNAFSPNNPNAEVRLFKPVGTNLQYYTIEVYDTWGNVLWTSNKLDENGSPAEGWNGIFNGNLLPQDTYMWKASGVFKDGTIWDGNNVGDTDHLPQSNYGTVHLIR